MSTKLSGCPEVVPPNGVASLFRVIRSGKAALYCLVAGLCLFGVVSPAQSGDTEKNAAVIVFATPQGDVTFSHENHDAGKCSTCHPPFDFSFNHRNGYSLRAHEMCRSCHEKSSVSAKEDCEFCHAAPRYETRTLDPATLKSTSKERQKILNSFFNRRSIRKFQVKDVPEDLLTDVLKAGMAAPSAGNWQPWIFVVVKDAKTKAALAATSPFAEYIKDAPLVIAVAGRRNNSWSSYDCALAAGNMLLAASSFGLGATYCGLDNEREGKGRAILSIPDDFYLYSFIPMGYPSESHPAHTKYNPDLIFKEKFDAAKPYTVIGHD